MNKIVTNVNIAVFEGFLLLFKIAIIIGTPIYKYIFTPMCWVLCQLAKLMPDGKTDAKPGIGAKIVNAVAHRTDSFIDNHIFKTEELESEKWTREWEAKGCPNYKNKTND